MTEKDFEGMFRRSLANSFPRRHRVRKHHADQYTGAGHPDFYGHIMGIGFECELKVTPNRPTDVQITNLIETVSTGGHAFLLIFDKDKQQAYLIMGALLGTGFSYRKREGWIILPTMKYKVGTQTTEVLDLYPLRQLLGIA